MKTTGATCIPRNQNDHSTRIFLAETIFVTRTALKTRFALSRAESESFARVDVSLNTQGLSAYLMAPSALFKRKVWSRSDTLRYIFHANYRTGIIQKTRWFMYAKLPNTILDTNLSWWIQSFHEKFDQHSFWKANTILSQSLRIT